MGRKVFEFNDYPGESITVWRLGDCDVRPGEFYFECYGEPSVSIETFKKMAEAIDADAKLPYPIEPSG